MAGSKKAAAELRERVRRLPTGPGCYLMKDKDGVVIYVGKAINLKSRVASYFNGGDGRYSVKFLMQRVRAVDFSLAQDEREALILENTLIKKYRPRYNVSLRDDKNYLSVRFDLKHDWPRLYLVRQAKNDGARYFGPFSSAGAVRQTLTYIGDSFPLRTCTDRELKSRSRPCLQYQIKRCSAPCMGYIPKEDYRSLCKQVTMILDGKDKELISSIETDMKAAAQALDFEEAAILRDRVASLRAMGAKQQVVSHGFEDRDILGYYREGEEVVLIILPVRHGKMQDNHSFHFKQQAAEDGEILASFINLYYEDTRFIPTEIICPIELPEQAVLGTILSERHPQGRKIYIRVPQRGDKTRLIKLAQDTARLFLQQELDQNQRAERALSELQRIMQLPAMPQTLECFDISNIQGKQPVASKVRFKGGVPEKAGYRRYKIKTLEEVPNDYGMMREVLDRRFRRSIVEGDAPDVLVVDGGKGQLNIAIAVLKDLGLYENQPVIGFAKPDADGARGGRPIKIDKIFLPGRKNPVVLPRHSACLKMLQFLRDESHRFAINFHRQRRRKFTLSSALDAIPGIGKKRRSLLLKTFGSVKGLKKASAKDISEVPGIGLTLAELIVETLRGENEKS